MRPLLLLSFVIGASAAQAQPAGWTIESKRDAQNSAAYKVVTTRAMGPSKLILERSMLNGTNYNVEHEGCTSSSGGAGGDDDPAARIEQLRTAMTELVRDKDNFCKLPPAAIKGLLVGLGEAIAATDAAYDRDRPTITVTPRSATKDGWTIEDKPSEAYEGLVESHILMMRKASGPVLLIYINTLPLSSEKVSSGSRSIEGKVRDCDYSDSDSTDFISPSARAKAFREQVAINIASTGCDIMPAQISAALAGFDAAYTMLDGWAGERLDERRMMLQSAGSDMGGSSMMMTSDSSPMVEDATMSARCAAVSASADSLPPGC